MNANIHELQARWPLFYYEERKAYHSNEIGFTIYLSPRSESDHGNISSYISGVLPQITVEGFDEQHNRLEIRNRLHESYPNLWFFIDIVTLRPVGVWVRRNDRAKEAIGISSDELQNSSFLDILNEQVGEALQEDWFWCSHCDVPKPKSEYAYFYFAGKYCKKCRSEDPAAYKRALAETYN